MARSERARSTASRSESGAFRRAHSCARRAGRRGCSASRSSRRSRSGATPRPIRSGRRGAGGRETAPAGSARLVATGLFESVGLASYLVITVVRGDRRAAPRGPGGFRPPSRAPAAVDSAPAGSQPARSPRCSAPALPRFAGLSGGALGELLSGFTRSGRSASGGAPARPTRLNRRASVRSRSPHISLRARDWRRRARDRGCGGARGQRP